jgi:hypothetical protein
MNYHVSGPEQRLNENRMLGQIVRKRTVMVINSTNINKMNNHLSHATFLVISKILTTF